MRAAVSYGRISVDTEASVAVAKQHKENAKYADAVLGLPLTGEYADEGVSATHVAPADRVGFGGLLDDLEPGTVVVVWSVDRLARSITDFWEVYKDLEARGCSLALSKENLDLSTPMGQVVLSILVAFAQMESRIMADRARSARRTLLTTGRAAGGAVPYGYQRVKNPDGPGYVVVKHPEHIRVVEGMVERVARGDSLYSVLRWLNDEGVSPPKRAWAEAHEGEVRTSGRRKGEPIRAADYPSEWTTTTTLDRIVRHPYLWGGQPLNTHDGPGKERGEGLLLDEGGEAVVREDLAVMTRDQHRQMLAALDADTSPQRRSRSERATTSPLLSGLVFCGRDRDAHAHTFTKRFTGDNKHVGGLDTETAMYRGTVNKRPGYTCPVCRLAISDFEDLVIDRVWEACGDRERHHRVMHTAGAGADAASLQANIEHLRRLQDDADDDEFDRLADQIKALRAKKREAETATPEVTWEWVGTGQTYAEAWAEAEGDVEARQALLREVLDRVVVLPGHRGRRRKDRRDVLDRLLFEWTFLGEDPA